MTTFAVVGCGGNDAPHTGKHDIWFMGAVIDGVTGMPLTDYKITLVWGSNSTAGKVDATTGRYVVGPLPSWNDYGVIVDGGTSYRPFSSYNAGIAPPAPPTTSLSADIYSADTTQTFDFDAFLFPTNISAPDVDITIQTAASAASTPTAPKPSGSIRLQPTTGQPAIQSLAAEVGSGGGGGQIWTNDRDLFAATVSSAFTDGAFKVPGPMLVYGVTYQVTVYGVDGFQPTGGQSVVAGVDSAKLITLSAQTVLPLQLLSSSLTTTACHPPTALTDTSSAVVTLTFNEGIEDPSGAAAEALDNGLYIGHSGTSIQASNVSSTVQERGVSFAISQDHLSATLSWSPNVGLTTKATGDVITIVEYLSLGSAYVQVINHPETRTSLSSLLGTSTIICQ